MPAELLESCGFVAAASLPPSVDTTELFLDGGAHERAGVSELTESLLSRRSDPSFVIFSPGGALGMGATVIQDLMGCKWAGT